EIAAGAVKTGIPLGLVPGGTGNLLAGNLRLPRDPAAAARVILAGRTAAIDLGSVERADGTHYFAVCSGTGFDARLMAGTGAAERGAATVVRPRPHRAGRSARGPPAADAARRRAVG